MKRFFVYTTLSDEFVECLQDSAFIICNDLIWERTRFDIAYMETYNLHTHYPFGLIVTTNNNLTVPKDIYESVSFKAAEQEYFIHYIYDNAPQFDSTWQKLYGESESIKYLVDTIYRYMLREAIKENEEWCGHFSSALRKL